VDIPVSLSVPDAGGKRFTMILRTSKSGRQTFEEARHFQIAGHGEPQPGTPRLEFLK
jgi:hypothetical protein